MSSLREASDDLETAIRLVEPRVSYVEALAQEVSGSEFRFDKAQAAATAEPHIRGAVFRAWSGSDWREATSTGLTRAGLHRAARELLDSLPGNGGSTPPPGESATGAAEAITPQAKPIGEVGYEELLARAREMHGWAMAVTGLTNANVGISLQADERLFVSSAGCRRYQKVTYVRSGIFALAQEGGRVELDYASEGGTGGAEILDRMDESRAQSAAREALALLKAPAAPSGKLAVILDPSAAGTFAHESFGHGTEADQILRNRSYLKPLLGTRLAPENLTLYDDGSMPGGWGSMFFDDEGQPARRTVLVDRGMFVGLLHDRESAAALGHPPTGNTRRSDYLSRPYVRMTNTCVAPGDLTLEELAEEAGTGVLMENFWSGLEDPLGGQMQITVRKGHRVENGRIAGLVRGMTLSGRVLDFLQSVRGLSRSSDFEMSVGSCGKGHGDPVPTGTGGPYLLSEAVVGPM